MSAGLVLAALVAAQTGGPAPATFRFDAAQVSRPPYRTALPLEWRYHAGDDPAWASPKLDDSGWAIASTRMLADEIPDDFGVVGWFRLHLSVPDELVGARLMLAFPRVGAAEIYLDGERVGRLGDMQSVLQGGSTEVGLEGDPVVIELRRNDPVLAVRFASPDVHLAATSGWPGGFMTFIGLADEAMPYRGKEVRAFYRLYYTFIGVALALTFLHLFIFVFMPATRANLYYAVSTLAVAALSLFLMIRIDTVEFSGFLWAGYGFSVSLVLLAIFGVRFLYAVVGLPAPWWRRVYFGVGAVLAICAWWVPVVVIYVYATIGLLEEVRTVIVGIRTRIRDVWILAVGLSFAAVMSTIQMLPMILGQNELWIEHAYVYGFFALLASMSIYLARDISHTHADLARRLIEVRQLSEATIAQERRVKSEEMLRVRLEEENKRQSMELDEANKRQAVLTQLEATNRELRDAQAQLVQSEKMAALGQLVAGIAHEINTPIGAVHSMHDSLEKATRKLTEILAQHAPELVEKDRKLRATLKVIEDATQVIESGSSRVATIVQRLKTFARLDEAQMQRADLEEGLADTLLLLHHELKRDIEVVRDFGGVPPINCYPGQLNQVFLNLLVNAKQAIEGSGQIRVRTRLEGDQILVRIEDTGCGIPAENLTRIFDPGFTTKGVKVGTGLGLAICYRIVQQHRGRIEVSSAPGEGTVFTVFLPTDLEEPHRSGSGEP